jgi:RNA polymerase sigma-70 factor (ECF subfamily)
MTAAADAPEPRDARSVQEDDLLDRARAGDTAAFGELVERYQGSVYRAALAALGSPADAEEAAQDAFVSAFRRLATFRGESTFKTWLVAIAWRKALTRRRRLSLLRLRSVRQDLGDETQALELAADPREGPHGEALGAELRCTLRALIRGLPAKLRDSLLLVASGHHSYEEAAAILGVPVGTAKWRVSEARRRLKDKLRAMGYAQ